ncbi:hypothetical protein MKK69_22740 [Methylobacterium sp. J-026]|uniref:hypothetical protein n=1 Tax=Methylobacterium sp. J-026 TaxID=2836624 RepID=UPI001FBBA948|nr:hypothetical protein [Methylobacterium sp. J-026]MCJ2136833.1 hypothetical protein [Methylobacterium sp. J-026]
MTIVRYCSAIFILYTFLICSADSQWSPAGGLLDVPVTNNCSVTRDEVATAKSDGIFYCPVRARIVDSQVADASHFDLVHAYAILAIHTSSKKLADCWAAHRLATAPNGPYYVRQWITYWRAYGAKNFSYGAPEQRIANVRSCCACGV